MMPQPQLIISDIDGTLIDSADRIPRRLSEVLYRASRAGAEIALATGRPHRWLYPVLDQMAIRPVCVTANGAVLFDSATETIIKRHELHTDAMQVVVETARRALYDAGAGELALAAERVGNDAFSSEEECFVVTPSYMHTWIPAGFGIATEAELISIPAVKLLLRNEQLRAPEFYQLVSPLIDPTEAHITYSMNEGLLEVSRPGVTKALGIRELCKMHGISQERTIAFGDMANDIEMLQWVSWGVAMGNANEEVKDIADEVTTTNNEAGVAAVLERWF
ncbi:Cof-type HAD-IIB family hydrolase [Corynebacterium caspium]|uniref:Cof-type HAD-IIB family hydrolase n=1 Tax=Corynebacterium caspium TaxID=234828 RepID=UPI00037A2AA9|nr:Cof-type HAD-IIB family hydrolase [Corynebacterium caspium]WKD59995.1 Putative phosphatase YwpJ [Corynebacterium caspium DSM 44850]